MSRWEVQALLNLPNFGGDSRLENDGRVYFLRDGSTLVCQYARQPGQLVWEDTDQLTSFERHRFEELQGQFPAGLFSALRAIHLAPPGVGHAFDPAALARAANALRMLGKDKALLALRAYVAFIKQDVDRADLYGLDEQWAFLIARVT